MDDIAWKVYASKMNEKIQDWKFNILANKNKRTAKIYCYASCHYQWVIVTNRKYEEIGLSVEYLW